MAETPAKKAAAKPADEAAAPKPSDDKPQEPQLLRAAESSDPAVHLVMAERQTAVLNNDEEAAAECDRRLADLGYTL